MKGPSLIQVYANRRMASLIGLGFASGLPLMLTGRTLTVWAKDKGVDLTTIGVFTSVVTLPYALKFLWAPVMDRFAPPLLGRRRGWIVITQVLLIAAIAGMAWLGPGGPNPSLAIFAAMAVAVTFLSATQDIVADAYRTDILKPEELGAGASVYMTGYRLAMLASGAGAVWLASKLPWSTVYLIAASGMAVGLIAAVFAPEPSSDRIAPRTFFQAVIEPGHEFIKRNRWRTVLVLLFIVAFKIPDYMASRMTDPLLLDLGFTKEQIAFWGLGVGTAVTIPGVIIGGPIVVRFGLTTALLIFGIAQALSNAGYMVLANAGANETMMIVVIGIEYFCTGLVVAGFVAYLTGQCDQRYSATQYALLSGVMGFSSTIAGAPTGWLVEHFGYPRFFLITIVAGVPGILMVPWLPKRSATEPPS